MKGRILNLLIPVLLSLVVWTGCKDDDDDSMPVSRTATFEMAFSATASGGPIAFLDTTVDYRGDALIPDLLQFFISNITLIDANDNEVMVKEVDWIDITYGDGISSFDVTPGQYKGIKFGIGLDAALNATDPTTVPADNPLSNTNVYWGWASKYQFFKVQGTIDSANTGKYVIFNIHTGFDEMYREVTFDKEFFVNENQTSTLNFTFDFNDIFTKVDTVDYYKLNERFWHGEAGTVDVARRISDNVQASMTLVE